MWYFFVVNRDDFGGCCVNGIFLLRCWVTVAVVDSLYGG